MYLVFILIGVHKTYAKTKKSQGVRKSLCLHCIGKLWTAFKTYRPTLNIIFCFVICFFITAELTFLCPFWKKVFRHLSQNFTKRVKYNFLFCDLFFCYCWINVLYPFWKNVFTLSQNFTKRVKYNFFVIRFFITAELTCRCAFGPLTRYRGSCLATARSRRGSNMPQAYHSLPRRRFAARRESLDIRIYFAKPRYFYYKPLKSVYQYDILWKKR